MNHPRDLLLAYQEGHLDDVAALQAAADIDNPTTAVGRLAASDRNLTEWLLGEPPWMATPKQIAKWFLCHVACWLLCIFIYRGTWQQWLFGCLAAHDVLQVVIRRRLPKGTLYEGAIGLLYGRALGWLVQLLLGLFSIGGSLFPSVLAALGLWAGLGTGFGLRRRLQLGEIFWSEVGSQVIFAGVAVLPFSVLIISFGEWLGSESAVGEALVEWGLLLPIAGGVGGLMPRKVEMGVWDAQFLILQSLGFACLAIGGMWFAVGIFWMHIDLDSTRHSKWFTWETLETLVLYLGGAWMWLDVCRGVGCSRVTWEQQILPGYGRVGGFFIQCVIALLGIDAIVLLGMELNVALTGVSYADYLFTHQVVGFKIIVAIASIGLAWRFGDVLDRAIGISQFLKWLRSAPHVIGESAASQWFALTLFLKSVRDLAMWISTFILGITRTALMMA